MKIQTKGMLRYEAIEHRADRPPAPIGDYDHWLGAGPPRPGDLLRPGGFAPAHRSARFRAVRIEGTTLHVREEDRWDRWCDLWRSIGAHKSVYGDPPRFTATARFLARGGIVGAIRDRRSDPSR